jgi:hypothetical protein
MIKRTSSTSMSGVTLISPCSQDFASRIVSNPLLLKDLEGLPFPFPDRAH